MPKWKKKTDANQKGIVDALRQIPGVSVDTDHDDILAGHQGKTYWFEIKNPAVITKAGTTQRTGRSLTRKKQEALKETWCGHYEIVWSLEQILESMGINQSV